MLRFVDLKIGRSKDINSEWFDSRELESRSLGRKL